MSRLARRAVREDDLSFLAALYLSTRPDLGALPVPRAVAEGIARHQQAQQRESYAAAYPDGQEWIVEEAGRAIGRLVLQRGAGALRVVDLSIASGERRRGHGRSLLRELQAEAAARGLDLTLRVRQDNLPARALYAGLGFTREGGDAAHHELRWRPPQKE